MLNFLCLKIREQGEGEKDILRDVRERWSLYRGQEREWDREKVIIEVRWVTR